MAFYGSDDQRTSKVAVTILGGQDEEPIALERWFSVDRDLRTDLAVAHRIQAFIAKHEARSVTVADRILGCPHEEGIRLSRRSRLSSVPVSDSSESLDRRGHSPSYYLSHPSYYSSQNVNLIPVSEPRPSNRDFQRSNRINGKIRMAVTIRIFQGFDEP